MPDAQRDSDSQNEMWEEEKDEALNGRTQPDEETAQEDEEEQT